MNFDPFEQWSRLLPTLLRQCPLLVNYSTSRFPGAACIASKSLEHADASVLESELHVAPTYWSVEPHKQIASELASAEWIFYDFMNLLDLAEPEFNI